MFGSFGIRHNVVNLGWHGFGSNVVDAFFPRTFKMFILSDIIRISTIHWKGVDLN